MHAVLDGAPISRLETPDDPRSPEPDQSGDFHVRLDLARAARRVATKTLLALTLLLSLVALLLPVMFPWVEPAHPFNDVTVDQSPPICLHDARRGATALHRCAGGTSLPPPRHRPGWRSRPGVIR